MARSRIDMPPLFLPKLTQADQMAVGEIAAFILAVNRERPGYTPPHCSVSTDAAWEALSFLLGLEPKSIKQACNEAVGEGGELWS